MSIFEKGDEIAYINGITGKGVKVNYSKILEINPDDHSITLENAMVIKFVKKYEPESIWVGYRNTKNGASVLVKEKF